MVGRWLLLCHDQDVCTVFSNLVSFSQPVMGCVLTSTQEHLERSRSPPALPNQSCPSVMCYLVTSKHGLWISFTLFIWPSPEHQERLLSSSHRQEASASSALPNAVGPVPSQALLLSKAVSIFATEPLSPTYRRTLQSDTCTMPRTHASCWHQGSSLCQPLLCHFQGILLSHMSIGAILCSLSLSALSLP